MENSPTHIRTSLRCHIDKPTLEGSSHSIPFGLPQRLILLCTSCPLWPEGMVPWTIWRVPCTAKHQSLHLLSFTEEETCQSLARVWRSKATIGIRRNVPKGLVIMASQHWVNAAFASILRRDDRIWGGACTCNFSGRRSSSGYSAAWICLDFASSLCPGLDSSFYRGFHGATTHHPWKILHRAFICPSPAASTTPHGKDGAAAFRLVLLNDWSRLTCRALDGRREWSRTRHSEFGALLSSIHTLQAMRSLQSSHLLTFT